VRLLRESRYKFGILLITAFLSGQGLAEERQAVFPLPSPPTLDPAKLELGKKIYNDKFFSRNGQLSCASCHDFTKGGADGLVTYKSLDKSPGYINTPTVFNAGLNFKQFWNGRVPNLEEVIDTHIYDATVFNNEWPDVISAAQRNAELTANFSRVYTDGITEINIKDALIAFLYSLLTEDAPFDLYLKGNKNALSEEAKKGFQLFKNYGCITCHQGPNIGGNLYERLGIYKDFFEGRTPNKTDLGLYAATGKEEDKHVFKVPSLRNVQLTAPYLHDGSAATLDDVVKIMGVYQVGQTIPDYEVPLIVKFLESLTGKTPKSVTGNQ
jgi:cytochrome c peroxidase